MFDYISDKLKLVAKILMILGWILSILGVIIFVVIAIDNEDGLIFIYGLFASGTLWFSTYISALMMHVYAKITDTLYYNNQNLQNANKKVDEIKILIEKDINFKEKDN